MQESYPLLRKAYAIIDGIPEKKFNLSSVILEGEPNPHNCDTIACAAGWIAMHPNFQELGLDLDNQGNVTLNGKRNYYWFAMAEIFNLALEDANLLFDSRKYYERNGKLERLTDKELWKYRVRKFLKQVKTP